MRASIACPTAHKAVSFELPTDAATVAKCWKLQIQLECPHCGERHAAPFKDAYADGVLTGASTMPPASFFTNLPDAPKRKVKHAREIALSSNDKNTEQVRCSTTATASIGRRKRTPI
jgi:hypothetical protein